MRFLKPNALNAAIPIAEAMQKRWPVAQHYPIAVRQEASTALRV
jgi:hypothetical protein